MDISFRNLSIIYPRRHCSVARMLIVIHKKKGLFQSIYKVNVQSLRRIYM